MFEYLFQIDLNIIFRTYFRNWRIVKNFQNFIFEHTNLWFLKTPIFELSGFTALKQNYIYLNLKSKLNEFYLDFGKYLSDFEFSNLNLKRFFPDFQKKKVFVH